MGRDRNSAGRDDARVLSRTKKREREREEVRSQAQF